MARSAVSPRINTSAEDRVDLAEVVQEEEAMELGSGGNSDEDEDEDLSGPRYGRRTLVSGVNGGRGSQDVGRIPGEYRPGG